MAATGKKTRTNARCAESLSSTESENHKTARKETILLLNRRSVSLLSSALDFPSILLWILFISRSKMLRHNFASEEEEKEFRDHVRKQIATKYIGPDIIGWSVTRYFGSKLPHDHHVIVITVDNPMTLPCSDIFLFKEKEYILPIKIEYAPGGFQAWVSGA